LNAVILVVIEELWRRNAFNFVVGTLQGYKQADGRLILKQILKIYESAG
jgi:hypothetical protein